MIILVRFLPYVLSHALVAVAQAPRKAHPGGCDINHFKVKISSLTLSQVCLLIFMPSASKETGNPLRLGSIFPFEQLGLKFKSDKT